MKYSKNMISKLKKITFIWHAIDILINSYMKLIGLCLNIIPGRPGNIYAKPLRIFFLRALGVKFGVKCQPSPGLFLYNLGRVEFGNNCSIGYNFKIWNFFNVKIGDNLLASHSISIISATHDANEFSRTIPGEINIGNNVWIGANVVIVGPCNIGDNVIIGANSYVKGVVESNSIYAGNPAKYIRGMQ